MQNDHCSLLSCFDKVHLSTLHTLFVLLLSSEYYYLYSELVTWPILIGHSHARDRNVCKNFDRERANTCLQ